LPRHGELDMERKPSSDKLRSLTGEARCARLNLKEANLREVLTPIDTDAGVGPEEEGDSVNIREAINREGGTRVP